MITATRVLRHARGYLGTQENPPHTNRTLIGAKFGWNGVPWCAETVCVILRESGFAIPKNASAPGLRDELIRLKWKNITPRRAKSGDVIFFSWPGTSSTIDHTGLVEGRTKDGRVVTIEGNTSLPNGNDGVARKVRSLSCVAAVVRPPYQERS